MNGSGNYPCMAAAATASSSASSSSMGSSTNTTQGEVPSTNPHSPATATAGNSASPGIDRKVRRQADGPNVKTTADATSLSGSESSTITTSSGGMTGYSGYPRYSSALDKSSSFSYRYSGLDRLTQQTKTGDKLGTEQETSSTNSSSLLSTNRSSSLGLSLSTKRELFFRQDGSAANATTNGTTTGPVLISGKDPLYGKENKEVEETTTPRYKERDRDRPSNTKDLDGYVGFANLPNQVYRKAVKKGFEFTLMVVGESGLGKSTLIDSMFLADLYSAEHPGPSLRIKKTVQVETTKALLKENGVNLTLTVVDTPGFGDAVDNSNCWQPVIDYIESKYEEYLNAESRVNRRSMPDSRVHCCLYFIYPSGHGLKPLDIEFMKRLHDKVNVIPVIAKADTMTPEECVHFKKTIMNEIAQHKVKIYEFPDCEDEEENKIQKPLKDRVPFAVVGSNVVVDVNGKKVRGRRYPWGIAEVENMEHCDFIALRNMLIRTHMQDLKDITNNVHYENYRCRKLAGVGSDGKPVRITNKNPLAQMVEEKKEREAKLKKMEQEMEQVFEMKVREKKQKLKDSETDLQRRHEQMKKSLEQQQKELEEKRKNFEKDKTNWEEVNKATLEDMRRKSLESNSKEHVDAKEKKKGKKGLFQ